ncbi:MAG: UDPGP type 1 family protein, partial [Lachnospiraceae bacterium]|nr:UDPGP type 1 family protein [Lachnospiraceae bacterium]
MELKEVKELLEKYNQEQLLKYYDELNEAEQKDLLRQISEIDFSVLKLVEEKNIEQVRGVIEPIN